MSRAACSRRRRARSTRTAHVSQTPLSRPPPTPRSYYNLARFNEKFERAYVMQAREEVAWLAREKEYLDNERALMAGTPGWTVGKRRYLTQWEDRPDRDVLDTRRPGAW